MHSSDRLILRDLAKRVAEAASLPIQAERRALWYRHNRLERVRPLILVYPQDGWQELLPASVLHCEDGQARQMEWDLRARLYHHEHFHDDTPIERTWIVHKVISVSGWGLEPRHLPSSEKRGAWGFDPVVREPRDLEKLRFPEVTYDPQRTTRDLQEAQELFGDILDVKLKGIFYLGVPSIGTYVELRGLNQVMLDMYDNPQMLHDAMAFIEEGGRRLIRQYVDLDLLSLNNDESYHASGGVGYSTELPAPDFDGKHVRPCDVWAGTDSQEMAQVGPALHQEFVFEYEKRLLAPFGLNGYGCCDDLTYKLDYVLTIAHLRRVSISPWANVAKCAERLRDRFIFSWKPHPGYLISPYDPEAIRRYIRLTLEATRGCLVEMILKDTHTCEHHPERFTEWTDIAQELAEQYAS